MTTPDAAPDMTLEQRANAEWLVKQFIGCANDRGHLATYLNLALTALAAATATVARLESENAMLLAVVDAARVYIHAADALRGAAELVGWYDATDAAGLER